MHEDCPRPSLADLGRIMAEEVRAAEQAVSKGVGEATEGLKTELRTQITNAGLGPRLARTWRSETYPKGQDSITAAGLVWSKAPGHHPRSTRTAPPSARRTASSWPFPTAAAGRFGDGGRKDYARRMGAADRAALPFCLSPQRRLSARRRQHAGADGQAGRIFTSKCCGVAERKGPCDGADIHSGAAG